MLGPLAFLVAVILAIATPAVAVAATNGAGSLTVEVVPAKVTLGSGTAVVRVANNGDAAVTGVALDVDAPAALTSTLERTDVGTLAPGGSALVRLSLTGTPGTAAVTARGQANGIPVSAAAAVELAAMAPHTLTLVGNTRLAEGSPADLRVVVANASDATVNVELSASAGQHSTTLDRQSFKLGPREVTDVGLTVNKARTLQRGTLGVVVHATITGADTQHLVAMRELTVVLAADELPGPLGVSSIVVVPGLVALLAFFKIRSQDRKRIGVAHPGAKAVWENKTWLLLAGGLSLVAAAAYNAVCGCNVLDAPLVRDITVLTVAVGGAGAVAALVSIWCHRRSTPVITRYSSCADVLRAAQHSDNNLERLRYKVGDKHGLLVHHDSGALVLTPPVSFHPTGVLFDAWDNTDDHDRFKHIIDALPADFDGVFNPGPNDIPEPTAVAVDDAEKVGRAEILVDAG